VPERRNVSQQLMRAPIVLAAVDLSQEWKRWPMHCALPPGAC